MPPDVLALATFVWTAVRSRPLPFIVMAVAGVTLGLVSCDRAFGVPPLYYWSLVVLACALPPAAWWGSWLFAHLPHFVQYINSQSDAVASAQGPVRPLPERPALPSDWLVCTAIWLCCLALAVGANQHAPGSTIIERILVEVQPSPTQTRTGAVLGAAASPSATAEPIPSTPVPHRAATGLRLEESACGVDQAAKLEVELSSPPPDARSYWLARTVEHDRTSLYPQGPPPVRRAFNPYFEFDVQIPLCQTRYFIAVWECTAGGNDVVDSLARASSTNYLSAIPVGCVDIGSFTFSGGQEPGPLILK